jgi:hypothetical protein
MSSTDSVSEIRALASGVRAVVLSLTLMLAFVNIELAFSTEYFGMLLKSPWRPIPDYALFIMKVPSVVWIAFSFVLPVMAFVLTFFCRNNRRALVSLAGGILLIFSQASLTSMTWVRWMCPTNWIGPAPRLLGGQECFLYDLLAGDGFNTWVGYLRVMLVMLAFAISMFFFWRFVVWTDPRKISM